MSHDDVPAPPPALVTSAWLLLMLATGAGAQSPPSEIRWRLEGIRPGPLTDSLILTVTAALTPGWYLYALNQPEGGPIATRFLVAAPTEWAVTSASATAAPRVVTPLLGPPQHLHDGVVRFRVGLRRLTKTALDPVLEVRYQVCSDRVCLPPRREVLPLMAEGGRSW